MGDSQAQAKSRISWPVFPLFTTRALQEAYMKKYIKGKEIIETYDIQEIELFELVTKKGLQPYDEFKKPLPDPVLKLFDRTIDELNVEIEIGQRYSIPSMTGLVNQEPLLKRTQENLKIFKELRQGYINQKKNAGTNGTWQWVRLKNDHEFEALKQFTALKNAIFLNNDVKCHLGQPDSKKLKTTYRSKTNEQIYIAAAGRAETVIQDMIHHDILPKTRVEKFKMLEKDKRFMKIIAALSRPVKEQHIIRKLNEVRPGIWQFGKASNKKYRKRTLY
jgi:hypothetical protein